MNVKVNYTVDIEEVPSLVQEMLISCQEELRELSNKKLNIFELVELANSVIAIRKRLALVDLRLEDAVNIVTGYHDAKLNPVGGPTPQQEPEDEQQ
jgi:hypothetical protein